MVQFRVNGVVNHSARSMIRNRGIEIILRIHTHRKNMMRYLKCILNCEPAKRASPRTDTEMGQVSNIESASDHKHFLAKKTGNNAWKKGIIIGEPEEQRIAR